LRAVIGLLDGACPVDASPTPMPEDAAAAAFLQMAAAHPPSPPPSPPAADDRSWGRAGPQRSVLRPDSPHPFASGSPVGPIAKHASRKAAAASNAVNGLSGDSREDASFSSHFDEYDRNEAEASQQAQPDRRPAEDYCDSDASGDDAVSYSNWPTDWDEYDAAERLRAEAQLPRAIG
jgi:hypothetical protein